MATNKKTAAELAKTVDNSESNVGTKKSTSSKTVETSKEAPVDKTDEVEEPKKILEPELPIVAEKKKKKIALKPKYSGLPVNDYGTWFTRKTKTGDVDANGVQIKSDRVFCLKDEDLEKEDTPAQPLIYQYDAKDDFENDILVAFKVPKIRKSVNGINVKDADGNVTKETIYKQHTALIEKIEEDQEFGIGFVGYWKTQLTQADHEAIAKAEEEKAKAIEAKAEAKAKKQKEKQEKAEAKAKEALEKAEKAKEKAIEASKKIAESVEAEGKSSEAESKSEVKPKATSKEKVSAKEAVKEV